MKTLLLGIMLAVVGCGRAGEELNNPMAPPAAYKKQVFVVNDDVKIIYGLYKGCTARVVEVLASDMYMVTTECADADVRKAGRDMTYLDPFHDGFIK